MTLIMHHHDVPTRRPPIPPPRHRRHHAGATRYDYYAAAAIMTALIGWAVYWLFDAFKMLLRAFLAAPWPFGAPWA